MALNVTSGSRYQHSNLGGFVRTELTGGHHALKLTLLNQFSKHRDGIPEKMKHMPCVLKVA